MKSLNHFLLHLVGAESNTEFICGTVNHIFYSFLDIIINVVHAEVQMFDLRVFDSHPLCNLFTILIYFFDFFYVIKLRHGFFRLFLRFEFLIFLDNLISSLQVFQMLLNFISWEWESSNKVEQWLDHICSKTKLTQSKILDTPIVIHNFSK